VSQNNKRRLALEPGIAKCPTGIRGLDDITFGGLPRNRPTLVCGAAGCGKTLMGMEFLVRGAEAYGEPGVFMSFEESADELSQNVASLGFNVGDLVRRNLLALDHVRIERSEIEETGEYDLEGLFIRLGLAIDNIGAKRVVLDTLEALFAGLSDTGILRAELRRLFRWLKQKGVTAVITAERGEGMLTRLGLEEYVSDCVIQLDNRIIDQLATRRLRIIKYRGSMHGTNEYPFLIDETGFSVLPITSATLNYSISNERISSGVPELDEMLSGKGFFRGSSILVSGTAGAGKTSLAAHFVDAACARGERCLYFAFEESEQQILRNMRSIGLNLKKWVDKGLLHFHAARATMYGLETHLALMHRLITEFEPRVVVADPISSFINVGNSIDSKSLLVRLLDFLKSRQTTLLFTNLTGDPFDIEQTDVGVSSIMDSWLLLRNIEVSGERNRGLYLLKSRGMAHSNQVREFLITGRGIKLRDVYVGPSGMLTGSARLAQEAQERAAELVAQQALQQRRVDIERRRRALEERVALMRAEFDAEIKGIEADITQDKSDAGRRMAERAEMSKSRGVNGARRPTTPGERT
jgi:circadian clock protein KaiC